MNPLGSKDVHTTLRVLSLSHLRDYTHGRDQTRTDATYLDAVTTTVKRTRFAAYTQRALNGARARGMTDHDIEAVTGIRASTFHRWQRGEVVPQIATIERFCIGLGLPVAEALTAVRGAGRQPTAPEPPMDPDVLKILRRLADPSVNDETKAYIRATMRYLADLPAAPTRAARSRRKVS